MATKSKAELSANILNTIRNESSTEYQEKVPVATRSNILEVGSTILSFQPLSIEFIDGLIEKVAKTVYANRMADNKFAPFKKGLLPYGASIEEMHINIQLGEEFDPEGADTLKRAKPDVSVAYHQLQDKRVFPITISSQQVKNAFTTADGVAKLLSELLNSLYSSSNHVEFMKVKALISPSASTPQYKSTQIVNVAIVDNETDAKAFVKAVKKASSSMSYMSTEYNLAGRYNYCPKDEQVLFIHKDYLAECNVEVLGGLFNLDKADFNVRIVEVDGFGDSWETPNSDTATKAILMDKEALQIYDTLVEVTTQHNAKGLFYNYFLHHHEILAMSPYRTAIVFKATTV